MIAPVPNRAPLKNKQEEGGVRRRAINRQPKTVRCRSFGLRIPRGHVLLFHIALKIWRGSFVFLLVGFSWSKVMQRRRGRNLSTSFSFYATTSGSMIFIATDVRTITRRTSTASQGRGCGLLRRIALNRFARLRERPFSPEKLPRGFI